MKLKNKTYDILKYIVIIVMPALTTLWLSIGAIWNFPLVEPIGATMAAITTFLGALIGISNANYKKENNNANQ